VSALLDIGIMKATVNHAVPNVLFVEFPLMTVLNVPLKEFKDLGQIAHAQIVNTNIMILVTIVIMFVQLVRELILTVILALMTPDFPMIVTVSMDIMMLVLKSVLHVPLNALSVEIWPMNVGNVQPTENKEQNHTVLAQVANMK